MKSKILSLFFLFLTTLTVSSQISDSAKFKFHMKFTGHTRPVEAVSFSKDGKWLASGGWDYNVLVYRTDTVGFSSIKYKLSGHSGAVSCVAFSPDSKFLASASKDFSIRLYGLEKGDLLYSSSDHTQSVTKVIFDPKSKYIMSSSLDATLRMYEFGNTLAKPKVIKYSAAINSFATATDGRSIYMASAKPDIENIDFKSTVIRSLKGHTGSVNCIELSPNGKMLASGSDDKTIIIWDLVTGKPLKTLKAHTWKVTSVCWSSDGNYLTSTCNDGITLVWDLQTGNIIGTLNQLGTNARSASWSSDMSFIAVATLMDTDKNGPLIYTSSLRKQKPVLPAKPGDKTKPGVATRPPVKTKPDPVKPVKGTTVANPKVKPMNATVSDPDFRFTTPDSIIQTAPADSTVNTQIKK